MPRSIDPRTALLSLRSDLCPACGSTKIQSRSVCIECWRELPRGKRHTLYQLIGDGYEQALADVLDHLGVESPHWPQERKSD